CSPISDTTILSSAGSGCNHIEHVSTQIPYSLLVAACATIGYLVAGFTHGSLVLSLGTAVCCLIGSILVLHFLRRGEAKAAA
ncbi:MAG: Na+/H+ antiporter NhaC family protein, partial [Sutterella sp.]|nr:Na+/H+ antiporter NhaC family protein [Sutterella sp.]